MKVRHILRASAVVAMLGNAGIANPAPAAAADNDMVDMFIMRDDVRFSETEESGRKRWEVRGTRAESQSADVIRIYDVRATFVRDNGDEICMYTAACDVNRTTREIQTDLHVDIIQGDSILSGVGMRVNHAVKRFQLFKDVTIVTFRPGGLTLNSLK